MSLRILSKSQRIILSILIIGAVCSLIVLTLFLVRQSKTNAESEIDHSLITTKSPTLDESKEARSSETCVGDSCTSINTTNDINVGCDDFKKVVCPKQVSEDSQNNPLLTSDDIIIDMLENKNQASGLRLESAVSPGSLDAFDSVVLSMVTKLTGFNTEVTITKLTEICSIVLKMFGELKGTLIQSLSSKSWFSEEEEKQKSINLVNAFQLSVITSDYLIAEDRENRDFIFNNQISKTNYFMNAYYSQKNNFLKSIYKLLNTYYEPENFSFEPYISSSVEDKFIKISAGLLHPPFLKATYSMSQKYGTIGWFIGRQLMYEANIDKKTDEQGHFQFSCTSAELTASETQLCCLLKQYDKKTYTKNYMKNRQDLDEKKLFFSSFTEMMCRDYSPGIILTNSQSSNSYNKFSVNNLLKHSQEFSDTYQCPVGSKMNPIDKCIL
ncbi:unnamed protein product [Schistosoma turkestanicum]|nr:unnamed protein product [Schistosoma turkestanicum]